MLLGYSLSELDSKSHMFGDESTLSKCPICRNRLDFFAHNPRYRLADRTFDLCATYDGQTIASERFRAFCERQSYAALRFLTFDFDPRHFHLIVDGVVPFDAVRRQTKFQRYCSGCGNYEMVSGATPAFLKLDTPLVDGIWRSDILFGSGREKGQLLIVGVETRKKLELAELTGMSFKPVESSK